MNNNQQDPRWASLGLGDGSTTIGYSGCTVSALGNILGLTPDVVNEKLKAVGGFLGALIIWKKIEDAFPGVKINRVWSYNNDDVAAHVPNVLVEVPAAPIGGSGSHWVVYIGNHQLKDPWTGTVRPTSDFPNPTGYCTIDVSAYTPPQLQDTQKVIDDLRTARDTNWNLYQAEVSKNADLSSQLKSLQDKITSLEGQVTNLNATNAGLQKNISDVQKQNADLADTLKAHNESDSTAVDLGIKAQTDYKNLLLEVEGIATRLNCDDDEQSILSAIDGLNNQIAIIQKQKNDQVNLFNKYIQIFIKTFIRGGR